MSVSFCLCLSFSASYHLYCSISASFSISVSLSFTTCLSLFLSLSHSHAWVCMHVHKHTQACKPGPWCTLLPFPPLTLLPTLPPLLISQSINLPLGSFSAGTSICAERGVAAWSLDTASLKMFQWLQLNPGPQALDLPHFSPADSDCNPSLEVPLSGAMPPAGGKLAPQLAAQASDRRQGEAGSGRTNLVCGGSYLRAQTSLLLASYFLRRSPKPQASQEEAKAVENH